MNSSKNSRYVTAWLLFLVVSGACLRLWHWSSQNLLDDEWHALNFVFTRSLRDIFLQQGLGANSIPVNVYCWITLHTMGWSEPILRLPSLVAGVMALVILPLLVKRIWGPSVAAVFAALLAVSPVIIFYSRILRPYAPAVLLATSSVLLTLIWMKEGRRRDILFSALCGSFAIYFHLYTAIPVGVPLLVALAAVIQPLGRRLGLILESKKPFSDLLIAAGIMVAIDGILVVIPNVINPWWSHGIHDLDHANLDTAVTVLSLISGTRNPWLMTLVLILILIGLFVISKRSKISGVALLLSLALFSLVMATTTQDGAHAGIQVVRYGLTFVPLLFVAVSVAVVWAGELLQARYSLFQRTYVPVSAAVLIWLPYLATSPLWTTYRTPNNFTNHSAYQFRYDPILWLQRSPERDLTPGVSMEYVHVPKFYLQSPLLAAAQGVIEYPVMIGDQTNIYFYYQHFHRRPVVGGFVSNNIYAPVVPGRDFVYGTWTIDSVMSAMPEPLRKKASWNTMADLNDISGLRDRFKGWIIVIHRDPLGELSRYYPPENQMILHMVEMMTENFGDPLYLGDQLAAWRVE